MRLRLRVTAALVVLATGFASSAGSHQNSELPFSSRSASRVNPQTTCAIESRLSEVDDSGNAEITWTIRVKGCPSNLTVTTGRFTYEVVIVDTDGQHYKQDRRTGWV